MTSFLRNRFGLFALLMSAILCVLGATAFLKKESALKPSGRFGKAKRSELVQRVTIAGTVVPARKTLVMAPYAGYIRKLYVKVGDRVKSGDPVVSVVQSLLDSSPVYPLRAPFEGTVVQIEQSEGEYVREGEPKNFLVRIDDLDQLRIIANAPEVDRVKMKIGQEALIKASAILTRSYHGVIRELSLAAKEKDTWGSAHAEFPLKIDVNDKDAELKPGMSTVIDILTDKKPNVLTLPHEFIHRENENYFVILKNGTKRPIEVGIQNDEVFEIVSGIGEGEEVRPVDFTLVNS